MAHISTTPLRRIESFRQDWQPVELERTTAGWQVSWLMLSARLVSYMRS